MRVAILGYGVVGRGVDEIIRTRVPSIEVARILELPDRLTDPRMTSDYQEILGDTDIEVVVECMGGLEPAHTFILAALDAGKSVVTSNKAVVAAFFGEFAEHAQASGTSLLIEATCGGGIPWIASIEKARRIDDVSAFSGIMNGTTNYIIDRMVKEGIDFDVALAQAQKLGYAERDPSADIDGIDVANKTIIGACVAFDVDCERDIPVSGIRTLTKADLDFFAEKGMTIKLLGRGVCNGDSYAVAVTPCAVPVRSLEGTVPDNLNLVTLEGSTIGTLKFYGQGAGSLPTGNAIVQDILDIAAGRKPKYDFSRGLAWDPTLLAGDFVIRTTAPVEGAEDFGQGYHLVKGLTAQEAVSAWRSALESDPTAFLVALS